MIIHKRMSKKRLDTEVKAMCNKLMRIIDNTAKEKGISFEEVVRETGIKENIFLDYRLPTLTQFLKICYYLEVQPHDLIGNVYTSHEVVLK